MRDDKQLQSFQFMYHTDLNNATSAFRNGQRLVFIFLDLQATRM